MLENLAESQSAILDLTERLIAIPTENPPGNLYPRCAALLLEELDRLGFGDAHLEGDCVLASCGAGARTLYFSGHYDVVPAQSPAQFEPVIQGANLFGRGSSDMKGGLAAMIYAAKAVRDAGLLGNGRIALVLVPDEETAGPGGSRLLASKNLLGTGAIGMLTPEPTGGAIWNANRGAITLKINVKGKPAHVGRQFEGVNAFERMIPLLHRLLALKHEVEQRQTTHNIAPAAARNSILMLGGRAEAGTNFNVVPDFCSFTLDRRINPEESFEEEKRRLHDLLDGLEVEILQEGASASTSETTPLSVALARSIERITGRQPSFEMCPGLLETRFYAVRGIPALAYGPGLLTVSHGPREFVPTRNLADSAAIYALTAAEVLAH